MILLLLLYNRQRAMDMNFDMRSDGLNRISGLLVVPGSDPMKGKFICCIAPWLVCLKSQVIIFTCVCAAAGNELLGGGCNKTIQYGI